MGKIEDQIIEVLRKSEKPLTLMEIAESIEKPPKKVFRSLRKLFEADKVHCDLQTRTYRPAKQ
jgi:DNA-binding IclR family transcriptional regulator